MHRWIVALALSMTLAPAAYAGGMHARIEGPDTDGIYTVRTLELDENDVIEPWALAQGVIDGAPRTVLIRLEPTDERGVYRFARSWPSEGVWMIRLNLGYPPAPATVASLRADGSIRSNKLYKKGDGSKECYAALRKLVKIDPERDDC
jgi:hypothetical protein